MDLQEHIAALGSDTAAEHLSSLTADELAALAAELEGLFRAMRAGEIEGTEPDDLDALNVVATAIRAVRAEDTLRVEAAAEEQRVAEERAAAALALEAELLAEPDPEPEVDPEPAAETTVEAPEEPVVEAEPEPVLVSAKAKPTASLAAIAAARRPAEAAPRVPAVTKPRWQLENGTKADFDDKMALAERIIEAQRNWTGARTGVSDYLRVASFKIAQPEELHLDRRSSAVTNQEKLDAAARAHMDWTKEEQVITASGGWCAPLQPQYTLPSISGAARPVRDGLVRIGAERGGLQFVRAARLSTLASSDTIWENSTDQTPGESTKARMTHSCRTIQEEALGAVVYRERFGNFQQRAFPEDVAHDIELGMANHARVAEVRLLDALIADMAVDVAQTGVLGTSRDSKHHLMQAAAEMAYTERSQSAIRAIVSDVLPKMVTADVTMQQASGSIDALLVDPSWGRQFLATSGLNFTYALDVPTGADAFVTNSDGENLADWPDNFEIPIFFDGTVAFLDGGELNLGIVRDSTLNNTNDYEIFFETFEGLIWMGPYGKTLTLTTCPAGDSQVALDNTSTLCSGS